MPLRLFLLVIRSVLKCVVHIFPRLKASTSDIRSHWENPELPLQRQWGSLKEIKLKHYTMSQSRPTWNVERKEMLKNASDCRHQTGWLSHPSARYLWNSNLQIQPPDPSTSSNSWTGQSKPVRSPPAGWWYMLPACQTQSASWIPARRRKGEVRVWHCSL